MTIYVALTWLDVVEALPKPTGPTSRTKRVFLESDVPVPGSRAIVNKTDRSLLESLVARRHSHMMLSSSGRSGTSTNGRDRPR